MSLSVSHRCAVLGSPIAHSLSPVIFSAAFDALGLDWDYSRVEITDEQLPRFIADCDDSWRGFSVTMPGKIAAVQIANVVSSRAKLVGAANTLYRLPNMLWGADNTDIDGVRAAIVHTGHHLDKDDEILILGAGGTARAALVAAGELSKTIVIAARNIAKIHDFTTIAEKLQVSLRFIELSSPLLSDYCRNSAVTISTLPIGVSDEYCSAITHVRCLIDVLYSPWPTPLAQEVLASGASVVSGFTILLYQAFSQFEHFTGFYAPREQMAKALTEVTGVRIPVDIH